MHLRSCTVDLILTFFTCTSPTQNSTLSLHDALPIYAADPDGLLRGHRQRAGGGRAPLGPDRSERGRSEEHTSELQSRGHLVCRLLLEKKKPELYLHHTSPPNRWSS